MDDSVIGIIVFFIVIIARIISSVSKNENKGPVPNSQRNRPAPTYQNKEYRRPQQQQRSNQRSTEVKQKYQYPKERPSFSSNDANAPEMPDVDYDKLSFSDIQNMEKETAVKPVVALTKQAESKRLIEFRAKLNNKNNFREAFLLSEILNKPKALRRW